MRMKTALHNDKLITIEDLENYNPKSDQFFCPSNDCNAELIPILNQEAESFEEFASFERFTHSSHCNYRYTESLSEASINLETLSLLQAENKVNLGLFKRLERTNAYLYTNELLSFEQLAFYLEFCPETTKVFAKDYKDFYFNEHSNLSKLKDQDLVFIRMKIINEDLALNINNVVVDLPEEELDILLEEIYALNDGELFGQELVYCGNINKDKELIKLTNLSSFDLIL